MAREIEINLNLECGYLDKENIQNQNTWNNDKSKITDKEILNKIGFLILDSDKATMIEKYELLMQIEKRFKLYKEIGRAKISAEPKH